MRAQVAAAQRGAQFALGVDVLARAGVAAGSPRRRDIGRRRPAERGAGAQDDLGDARPAQPEHGDGEARTLPQARVVLVDVDLAQPVEHEAVDGAAGGGAAGSSASM